MPFDPRQSPYNSIVRITETFEGQVWQASGVMLSDDEVLTADHVTWRYGVGAPTNLSVTWSTASAGGTLPATIMHTDASLVDWPTSTIANSARDYAVIRLSDPIAGVTPMHLAAGPASITAHITGFPVNAGVRMVDDVQTLTTIEPGVYRGSTEGGLLGPGISGGPVWAYADGQAAVYGVAASQDLGGGDGLYASAFTQAQVDQIFGWVAQDDTRFLLTDTSTGQSSVAAGELYAGPVAGITRDYITTTPDNLAIAAVVPNVFIHTGSGSDAIQVLSGRNVLDGGTGSNFLVGGTGIDTFFVDARNAPSDTWSTVVGAHTGDDVTVFGLTPENFSIRWTDGEGAANARGLTMHATSASQPTASFTLAGFSTADLASGRVAVDYGANGSEPYMHLRVC